VLIICRGNKEDKHHAQLQYVGSLGRERTGSIAGKRKKKKKKQALLLPPFTCLLQAITEGAITTDRRLYGTDSYYF